jgi:hypothetical protein
MLAQTLGDLRKFFETSRAAAKATRHLARGAEVALVLDGGTARFTMESGVARIEESPACDPDFTLTIPDGAVGRIVGVRGDDVGQLGVEFFKLVFEKDPALKVHAKVHVPTARLLAHGYLSVLATGGMKMTWWLLRNGVKNPRAAIDRLWGR